VAPNPEAIAWYVEKSERLLDDLRERVLAQRARGGQLAGFSGAVLALVVANYTSDRFTHEPDLWRVHVRAIHGLLASIESITWYVDAAARIVEKAEYFFLSGLFTVGIAFATLIVEVTF
jgi:hypothetical protein